jgi:hypothetical protein
MTHFHYRIFYGLIRKIANSFRKIGLPNFRNDKIVPKFLRFVRLSGIRKFFSVLRWKKSYCECSYLYSPAVNWPLVNFRWPTLMAWPTLCGLPGVTAVYITRYHSDARENNKVTSTTWGHPLPFWNFGSTRVCCSILSGKFLTFKSLWRPETTWGHLLWSPFLDHFTEKSFHRNFLTVTPFDRTPFDWMPNLAEFYIFIWDTWQRRTHLGNQTLF